METGLDLGFAQLFAIWFLVLLFEHFLYCLLRNFPLYTFNSNF